MFVCVVMVDANTGFEIDFVFTVSYVVVEFDYVNVVLLNVFVGGSKLHVSLPCRRDACHQ